MSKLKEVIKKADATPDMTKDIKETLQLLYELSDEKATTFENTISQDLRSAGTTENPTVPIKYQLASFKEIRVTTSETPSDIINEIGTSLKDIIKGTSDSVINGISSLINTGLQVILGAGEGQERLRKEYYIATEGLSIVRLDIMMWSRSITASSITKYAEESIVCLVVKSSVDLSKVDFNSFLSAYNLQLQNSNLEHKDILEEIQNAKEVYKELTSDSTNIIFNENCETQYLQNILQESTSYATKQWPYGKLKNLPVISNAAFLDAAQTYHQNNPEGLTMCNQFIFEAYKLLNCCIMQLEDVHDFLPRNTLNQQILKADITVSSKNRVLDLNAMAPQANIGDIVVFYTDYSGNSISHTMVIAENNVLLGSNNCSTFNNINDTRIKYIDLINETLQNHVNRVVVISPNDLAQFHDQSN